MNRLLIKITAGAMAIAVALAGYNLSKKYELNEKFISEVRSTNHTLVNDSSDNHLINLASNVCISLSLGADPKDLIFQLSGAEDYSQETLVIYGAIIVKYSVQVFCPEYTQQIEDWVL